MLDTIRGRNVMTNFVRSNPGSSSKGSSTSGVSVLALTPFLVGLPSPLTGGGLLLNGIEESRPEPLIGLMVFPLSANLQKKAGDDCGIN
jgi:hypothetical protein